MEMEFIDMYKDELKIDGWIIDERDKHIPGYFKFRVLDKNRKGVKDLSIELINCYNQIIVNEKTLIDGKILEQVVSIGHYEYQTKYKFYDHSPFYLKIKRNGNIIYEKKIYKITDLLVVIKE